MGHKVSHCTSSRHCRHYNRRHHQAICDKQQSQSPQDSQPSLLLSPAAASTGDEPIQTSQKEATTASNAAQGKADILLQTAKALACIDNGQTIPVRVILDGGNQRA